MSQKTSDIRSRMDQVLETLTSPIVTPVSIGMTSATPPMEPLTPNPGVMPNSEVTTKSAVDHDLVGQVADVLVATFHKSLQQDPSEYAVQSLIQALKALAGPQQMLLVQRFREPRKQHNPMEPGVLRTNYSFDNK